VLVYKRIGFPLPLYFIMKCEMCATDTMTFHNYFFSQELANYVLILHVFSNHLRFCASLEILIYFFFVRTYFPHRCSLLSEKIHFLTCTFTHSFHLFSVTFTYQFAAKTRQNVVANLSNRCKLWEKWHLSTGYADNGYSCWQRGKI